MTFGVRTDDREQLTMFPMPAHRIVAIDCYEAESGETVCRVECHCGLRFFGYRDVGAVPSSEPARTVAMSRFYAHTLAADELAGR